MGGRTHSESDALNSVSALCGSVRRVPGGITAAGVTLRYVREAAYGCSRTVGPNDDKQWASCLLSFLSRKIVPSVMY